jgi:hypothetical protein
MQVETEVVYHCTPDRAGELRASVESLFDAGSLVDRVTVYAWGGDIGAGLEPYGPKVVVAPVEPLFGEFSYANVLYACSSEAPRVVYLDVDTIVLKPLNELWAGKDADVLARVGTAFELRKWRHDIWEETFRRHGSDPVPMFNTGLVVFQHRSQRKLRELWERFTWAYLRGEETAPWNDWRIPQQFALSLAVGVSDVDYSLLGPREHAFGWTNESYEDAVVFHTGGEFHARFMAELADRKNPRER